MFWKQIKCPGKGDKLRKKSQTESVFMIKVIAIVFKYTFKYLAINVNTEHGMSKLDPFSVFKEMSSNRIKLD